MSFDEMQRVRQRRIEQVKADPRFLYIYSPKGTIQNERYVFTDHTSFSLAEALEYVLDTPHDPSEGALGD